MAEAGPSNVSVLTQEKRIWLAKKRQKKAQVKEILFDEGDRREFLTGFRKRKLARLEASKAKAREREHQSRLEARREKRKDLAERAAQNAKEIEKVYAGDSGSDSESCASSQQPGQKEEELQFQNEEQFATVTVVEDLDVGDLKALSTDHNHVSKDTRVQSNDLHPTSTKKFSVPIIKPKSKFRYGTRTTGNHEKAKQRSRKEARRKQGSMKKFK